MSKENSQSKSSLDSTVSQFISPLTIQAQLLLDTIEKPRAISSIDPVLASVFERLTFKILQYINKNDDMVILPSETTKLIGVNAVEGIQEHYYCSTCNLTLGNGPESAALHLIDGHKNPNEMRKQRKEIKEVPIKVPKKLLALVKMNIEKLVLDHIKVADKLKYSPLYETFETDLYGLLKTIFPDKSILIYKFGSRTFGLGFSTSDLDVYVDIDNSFNLFENSASKRSLQYIDATCGAIRRNPAGWIIQYAVKKARVPILRLVNVNTELKCDIGFSNSLGFCNTILLEYIFKVQPIVRHVCMALKIWLQRAGISESFSYYTVVLMAIFSFQMMDKLPSIAYLQTDMDEVINVGPWIGNIKEKSLSEIKIEQIFVNQSMLKLHIFKFFEFYTNFNFDTYAICPYYGRMIEKAIIEQKMPKRYSNYVTSPPNEQSKRLQIDKCVVLQDPLQLNHNVAKGIAPSVLKVIKHFFRRTYEEALATSSS